MTKVLLKCNCNSPCCKGTLAEFNLTYNYCAMYRVIMGEDSEFFPFDDKIACDTAPLLEKLLKGLKEREQEVREKEPTNGWGDYPHFLVHVQNMLDAVKQYPQGVWSLWR